jgi:hypothetical protein
MFLFLQLRFIQLIFEVSILLGYKIKNQDWTWVVYDASKSSTNLTKDVKNETPMLNAEPREESLDRGSENSF